MRHFIAVLLCFLFVSGVNAHHYLGHQHDPWREYRKIDCQVLDHIIEDLEWELKSEVDTSLIHQILERLEDFRELRENLCIEV